MYIVHTGYFLSGALIFASINPSYNNKLCSVMSSLQENYKLRTCCVVHIKLFIMLKQKQFDVHNMHWTCSFLALNKKQSIVIFRINWCKNEWFWWILTCTAYYYSNHSREEENGALQHNSEFIQAQICINVFLVSLYLNSDPTLQLNFYSKLLQADFILPKLYINLVVKFLQWWVKIR